MSWEPCQQMNDWKGTARLGRMQNCMIISAKLQSRNVATEPIIYQQVTVLIMYVVSAILLIKSCLDLFLECFHSRLSNFFLAAHPASHTGRIACFQWCHCVCVTNCNFAYSEVNGEVPLTYICGLLKVSINWAWKIVTFLLNLKKGNKRQVMQNVLQRKMWSHKKLPNPYRSKCFTDNFRNYLIKITMLYSMSIFLSFWP